MKLIFKTLQLLTSLGWKIVQTFNSEKMPSLLEERTNYSWQLLND